MKSTTKANVCASAAAIFLIPALAGLAHAQLSLNDSPEGQVKALLEGQVTGSLQGHETDVLQGDPPRQNLVNGEVKGVATHLGRFTMTYSVTVSLPAGTSTGSVELVVAHGGDKIFTTVVGYGKFVPGMLSLVRIVEINTITGGTGRFKSAQGSFIVERSVDVTTGLTSGYLKNT
jgi:hypothetical protein